MVVPGGSSARRLVASTPSMIGIRMSMTMTSGRSSAAAIERVPPIAASPTTSISSSSARIIRKPVRTSSWSSTSRTRTLMQALAVSSIGRCAVTRKPIRRRMRRECAAEHGHSLTHADSPRPSCSGSTTEAAPGPRSSSIGDVERAWPIAHGDARPAAARMLQRVREGLLDDPVRRQLKGRVEGSRAALDVSSTTSRPRGPARAGHPGGRVRAAAPGWRLRPGSRAYGACRSVPGGW